MKRYASVLSTIVIAFVLSVSASVVRANSPGDADGNGQINVLDVIALINVVFNNQAVSPGADCDSNGSVNVLDVICAINIVFAPPPPPSTWTTGTYSNNANISQVLSATGASSLVVRITGETESGYDYITIYDADGNQVRRHSGSVNQTFIVNSPSIRAELTSDGSVTASGVTVSVSDATRWVTGEYLNDANLSQILGINDASSLLVTITGETEENFDYITIYDGNNNEVGRFSGSIDKTLIADTPWVRAVLTSDGSATASGVTVSVVEVTSSWTTGEYPNNANLSQILGVSGASSLLVTISGETETNFDYITIYDGNGYELGRFSGSINETLTVHVNETTVDRFWVRAVLTSDGSVTASGVTVSVSPVTSSSVTLSGIALGTPTSGGIVNGNVEIKSLSGAVLATGVTGDDGSFSIEVDGNGLEDGYEIIVFGGEMAGAYFSDELRAIYSENDSKDEVNVTPVTSIIAKLVDVSNGADRLENRNETILRLAHLGLIPQTGWNQVDIDSVDENYISAFIQLNGLSEWLTETVADLEDNDLSASGMNGFPDAHGGIANIHVQDDISFFPGDVRENVIEVKFFGTSTEGNEQPSYQLTLEGAPSWVEIIDNNILKITAPLGTVGTIPDFTIKATADGAASGRGKSISLAELATTTLLTGSLGPNGGTIENQWRDISISVEPNKLTQNYDLSYIAGEDENGTIVFRLVSSPFMPLEETASLDVVKPDLDIMVANYLTSQGDNARRANNETRIVRDALAEFQAARRECNVPWEDRNDDGFGFTHVWDYGIEEFFDHQGSIPTSGTILNFAGKSVNGYNRLLKNKTVSWPHSSVTKCSFALRSSESKNSDLSGKTPVIFVHGFIPSLSLFSESGGNLGGFDSDIEYFGKFPKLISELNLNGEEFVPFIFQWKTSARYQDVAKELGRSINFVTQKTGKKVHIIAHSFGGLLTRTLVQGLTTESGNPQNVSDWAENKIASITTIGTPHSGISNKVIGSPLTVNFGQGEEIFPRGTDTGVAFGAQGSSVKGCDAITCYQSGYISSVAPIGVYKSLFGIKNQVGYIPYTLFKTIDTYPNIPTQQLIGLVPSTLECETSAANECFLKYDFGNEPGDHLISLNGQRFRLDDGRTTNSKIGNVVLRSDTNIEEHFLGLYDQTIDAYADELPSLVDSNNVLRINIGYPYIFDYHLAEGQTIRFSDDRARGWTNGYKHSGTAYSPYSKHDIGRYGSGRYGVWNTSQFTEMGLNECASAGDCDHPSWRYVVRFFGQHPSENIGPQPTTNVTGRVTLSSASPRMISTSQSLMSRDVGELPVSVYLFRDGENVGELTQQTAGDFALTEAVFIPNTEYKLAIVPDIGSGLRGGYSAPIISGETVDETALNFPVFDLISTIFAEGEVGIVLKDGASGVTLSGYEVEIINYDGQTLETTYVTSGSDVFTLPAGRYLVNVTKDGYESSIAQDCQVVANLSSVCNISLLPSGHIADGTLTAVLTWQIDPRDLDTHLIKYDSSGSQQYHLYYRNRSDSSTGDNLDTDDISSYGPETMTIQDVDETARYVYAVHHYNGNGSISTTSSAIVNVQTSSATRTYNAPTSGEGIWWKVFEVENGRVIPCQANCLFDSQGEVLSVRSAGDQSTNLQPLWLSDILKDAMPSK